MRACCLLSIIFLSSGLAASQSAIAQTKSSDSDDASLKERVQQLEQLVSRLEQKIDKLEAAAGREALSGTSAAPARNPGDVEAPRAQSIEFPTPEQPTVSAGRNTFSISSRDKLFRLRIGGHLQADGKTAFDYSNPHQTISSFSVRRARPIFEGSLGQYIEFRFVPDFGTGKAVLYDAYADIKIRPYAVVRAGKMKTPLGLEQLQSDADLTFIERSLATDLVPNRDAGFELYGSLSERLSYAAAVLNGAPVGQSYDGDVNNGKDVVGRLFFTPFAASGPTILQGLGFGMAASSGRQEGAVLPSFNTTGGQVPFFSYGSGSGSAAVVPSAAGRRINYTPQLYFYGGPFGLMAEFVDSTQKVSAVIDNKTVAHNISNRAWQIAGSWVLTGEKKSFKGVVPRKSIEDRNTLGWGAWEVAGRYAELNVDPTAFSAGFADPAKSASSAHAWTVGFHWYLNYFVKLQLEYEQTHFRGGIAGGDRATEKVFEQRLQFAF